MSNMPTIELQLDHLEARTFPGGTMIHTYRPHGVNR